MSGALRELKNRIRSVENTKKITRAMEMVAAAKLRRFQNLMVNAKPYTEGLKKQLLRIHSSMADAAPENGKKGTKKPSHPFFDKRDQTRTALVLITSDTGLCGSYNLDLINMARGFLAEQSAESQPLLVGIGKSGISALQRSGYRFEKTFTDLRASRVEEILAEVQGYLQSIYLEGEADAIYVVYSHFKTLSRYEGVREQLLPLEEPESEEGAVDENAAVKTPEADYIFEPSAEEIFKTLVPVYFEAKTRMIFLEALVSEQIARMNAMHQATKNAKEMIDALVLKRNKARQAMITKEIIEIVSGSQALKNS